MVPGQDHYTKWFCEQHSSMEALIQTCRSSPVATSLGQFRNVIEYNPTKRWIPGPLISPLQRPFHKHCQCSLTGCSMTVGPSSVIQLYGKLTKLRVFFPCLPPLSQVLGREPNTTIYSWYYIRLLLLGAYHTSDTILSMLPVLLHISFSCYCPHSAYEEMETYRV